MTTNHLLSTSLFTELFQHNLVSANGRIIANTKQMQDYYYFLVQQSKSRVSMLYAERKNIVDSVQKLLGMEYRTEEQTKLLKRLLKELDLKLEEDGELTATKLKSPRKKYLGPKEPKMSLFEIQIETELKRLKILKRDLKMLDEWLSEISTVRPMGEHILLDPKQAGGKLNHKIRNRMVDMEKARAKLIREFYTDYDRDLNTVLCPKSRELSEKKTALRPESRKLSDTRTAVRSKSRELDDTKTVLRPESMFSNAKTVLSSESQESSDTKTALPPESRVSSDTKTALRLESRETNDTKTALRPESRELRDTNKVIRPESRELSDMNNSYPLNDAEKESLSSDSGKSEDTVVVKQEPKNSSESDIDSSYLHDS